MKTQTKHKCYVLFLNRDKGFKQDKKNFQSYEEAWDWIRETFDSPSKDFIHYY